MNLSMQHASFAYEAGKPVFSDVTFETSSGQILSVLGQNGAGKTTLMKCLLRFCPLTDGTITLDGRRAETLSEKDFRRIVSYVPQAHTLTFPYTVQEMVLMGRGARLGLFGAPGKKDHEAAREAMRLCGVEELASRSCAKISGGQMQLVLIARALSARPRILLMDEPETGLDYAHQLQILSLLKRLAREEQILIVFNTHYPQHALDSADKALLLMPDHTAVCGEPEKVLTLKRLESAYGVAIRKAVVEEGGRVYTALIPIEKEPDAQAQKEDR